MKRNQSGFTLIEIAIVLVIIGLLIGGVLKGQELINSAKVKNFATDFKNIPVFIYGYQDKFKALPGDDNNAVSNLGAACTGDCKNSTGSNGVIGGVSATDVWNSTTLTDETQLFWLHVRHAGLAAGSTSGATDYRPTNSANGRIGIQSNIKTGNGTFTTITKDSAGTTVLMTGTYIICSESILGKFAKQLDTTMDNGNTDTGSMRVADGATGKSVATSSIDDATSYTVCMGF